MMPVMCLKKAYRSCAATWSLALRPDQAPWPRHRDRAWLGSEENGFQYQVKVSSESVTVAAAAAAAVAVFKLT